MRIRSTKPEFWRSKTITDALDWEARFVLKALESYVDDNGVGKDDIEIIATEVFPRDTFRSPRETVARLSEAISRIHQAGLIARYVADEEKLLYVDKWKDFQRIDKPGKGRFPRPDGTLEYSEAVSRDSYRSPRDTLASPPETLAPGTGEQGNRGTGEKEDRLPVLNGTSPAPNARKAGGMELARQLNATARSVEAYDIAAAYSKSLTTPIETGLLTKVGTEIDKCLKANIPPPAIAAGLQAWTASDSWSPSQIPTFVHKAGARSSAGNGKPTRKAISYADAAEELLAQVTTL